MYAFQYHEPRSVDEASRLAGDHEDGKLLAGGMTLLPTMKQRLAAPSDIIDLRHLDLRGVDVAGDVATIGAMTRHVTVANSEAIAALIPSLVEMAAMIGDPAVRNRGTIGGSIANNDPAADYPAACLALGATIHTNKRSVAADDFFNGLFETALEPGELVVKVSFPKPDKGNYQKFRNPASRYAIVGVYAAKKGAEARVAVTGAGANGVFRVKAFEDALRGNFSPDALKGLSVAPSMLNSDIHADAEYRAHLIGVLARRAVAAAK